MSEIGSEVWQQLHAYHDGELGPFARWRVQAERVLTDRLGGDLGPSLGQVGVAEDLEIVAPPAPQVQQQVVARAAHRDVALGMFAGNDQPAVVDTQ